MQYNKLDELEEIKVGDIISYVNVVNSVTRAQEKHYKETDKKIIGVCTAVKDNIINVESYGILDVNVNGIICIGDQLTASNIPGEAVAIKYAEDNYKYDYRSLGKVIQIYNDYSKAKVLLDVE